MARGNRGSGLLLYADNLYDGGHRIVFAGFAYRELVRATDDVIHAPQFGYPPIRQHFLSRIDDIKNVLDPVAASKAYIPDGYSLGETTAEQDYRAWCLRHALFLNPLNDLEGKSIAAGDILNLPDFVTDISEPPALIGLYNQMKQEFASARWLYFESLQCAEPHFSDRDVLLFNTLDYPAYGLAVEKLRISFRMAYSLFDKVAFFINHYMALGLERDKVSLRNIWREHRKAPLRPQFEALENLPLRGLYWLSRDLFEDTLEDVLEPDARALHAIRNHLEHKYLKIHEMLVRRSSTDRSPFDPFTDTLAHSIARSEFSDKTLRLLKLSRAALIYLSLGMHWEERRRRKERGDAASFPVELDRWDDAWKT